MLETEVHDFPRRELGAWDLVYRALDALVRERNTQQQGAAAVEL